MQKKSFSKGKEIILIVVYHLIFAVIVYKIVMARSTAEASLSTNREKAYYFYGLARIALGCGNLTAARENLDLAQRYGAGLHVVKTLQIPEALICEG